MMKDDAAHGRDESVALPRHLYDALRAARVGLWNWDIRAARLEVSPEYRELIGHSGEQGALGLASLRTRLHPDDRERTVGVLQDFFRNPVGECRAEFRLKTSPDTYRWFLSKGTMQFGEDGQPLRMLGALTEITLRKEAEAALRESEARRREAQRLAHLGHWVLDPASGEVQWSEEIFRMFGRDPAKGAPPVSEQVLSPESHEAVTRAIERTLQTGEPYELDVSLVHPDGGLRWLSARGERVSSAEGAVLRLQGTVQDITERRMAADALRESERRFRAMLDNVALLSVMLDGEGRVTYCNDHLLAVSRRDRGEVEGADWFTLFVPPEQVDAKRERFRDMLKNRHEAWHHEESLMTRCGKRRYVRWNNSVLRSPAGAVIGITSIGEDITESKEQQEKISQLLRTRDMMSGINALIVRARRRLDLYEEACRIAVERGGYALAWIGMAHGDELATMSAYGSGAALMRTVRFSRVPGGPNSMGPTVTAWREGKLQVCGDAQTDPLMAANREFVRTMGVRSFVAAPLWVGGEVRGCLSLFLSDANHFDDAHLALIEELASDLAYALEFILRDEKLDRLALYDPLTNLPNRVLLIERLQRFLESAREGGKQLSISKLDIDNFNGLNAMLGRTGGDELLRQVGERVKEIAHGASYVARTLGDRFAIVVPDIAASGEPAWGRLSEPFHVGNKDVRLTFKIGTAVFPGRADDAETLLRDAEAALKHAKENGLPRVTLTRELGAALEERRLLESQLRRAIEQQEFVLHYQPKVDLRSGAVTGAEALLRWQDPQRGLIEPGQFVPVLEDTGLIVEVGRWVIRQAIDDRAQLVAAGLAAPRLAVNLSAVQLREEGVAGIRAELARVPGAAAGLELEVTESAVMSDIDANVLTLQSLCEEGISVALDDFGTGYSSLAYLARLPLNTVKIDRSFVASLSTDASTMAITSAVMAMARALHLTVVAEGVETQEQLRFLRLLMCDQIQGHVFSKPLPLAQLMALLKDGRKLAVAGA